MASREHSMAGKNANIASLSLHEARPSEQNESGRLAQSSRPMSRIAWLLVLIALLSSIFLFSLDNTVVADVQPSILNTLGEIDKLSWISVSFGLGAVASNLVWGKMFGQFNNKWLFIASVVVFEIGSALCGAASTMNVLIVGRALCGVGGMGSYLGTMNILASLTTEATRPLYLSFVGLVWGLGTVLGPLIGGAFADSSATWRWSFYINLCIGGATAPIYLFLIPSIHPKAGQSFKSRLSEMDFTGILLIAGAWTTVLMGIAFGGGVYDWSSRQIIALFTLAGVLWLAFVCQQKFCWLTSRDSRLFPVEYLKSWEMCILFVQTAAPPALGMVTIYYIPIYFQFVRGERALEAGVRLLPFVILLVFAMVVNGAMMAKLGYYMPWYFFGSIIALAGSVLLCTISIDTSVGRIYGYLSVLAIGTGLFSQASFPIVQVKVAPHKVPAATSFVGFGQISGISLSLAIANAVFLNEATNRIQNVVPSVPRNVVQQAISGATSAIFDDLTGNQRAAALDAILAAIKKVFILLIVASCVVLIFSVFMKRERLFIHAEEETPSMEGDKSTRRSDEVV